MQLEVLVDQDVTGREQVKLCGAGGADEGAGADHDRAVVVVVAAAGGADGDAHAPSSSAASAARMPARLLATAAG